jgi:acyl-CoA thioester hydrolase
VSARNRPIEGDFRYRHPVEVRYGDTDALGHVNNATYLSYFEAARAGYYALVAGRPFGTGPDAHRHTFVIAEARVIYRQPAFFGEPLVVEARVSWASRSSFGLEYRVLSEGGPVAPARLVADGETTQVMFDLGTARPSRIPADLLAAMEAFEGRPIPSRPGIAALDSPIGSAAR